MNPFDGIAHFFLGLIEHKTLQGWLRLLFELTLSGLLTFMLACGGVLVTPPHSWAVAIGTGLITAAVIMTVVFRRSPLTKNMMLILPAWEAAKEIETNMEVIQKGEQK